MLIEDRLCMIDELYDEWVVFDVEMDVLSIFNRVLKNYGIVLVEKL